MVGFLENRKKKLEIALEKEQGNVSSGYTEKRSWKRGYLRRGVGYVLVEEKRERKRKEKKEETRKRCEMLINYASGDRPSKMRKLKSQKQDCMVQPSDAETS